MNSVIILWSWATQVTRFFFQPNADIRDELNDWLSQELECAFMELNCDISEYEVKLAISQLKSGKSGGENMSLN